MERDAKCKRRRCAWIGVAPDRDAPTDLVAAQTMESREVHKHQFVRRIDLRISATRENPARVTMVQHHTRHSSMAFRDEVLLPAP